MGVQCGRTEQPALFTKGGMQKENQNPTKRERGKICLATSMKKQLQQQRAIQQPHQDFMSAAKRCRELLEEISWYRPTGKRDPSRMDGGLSRKNSIGEKKADGHCLDIVSVRCRSIEVCDVLRLELFPFSHLAVTLGATVNVPIEGGNIPTTKI
jgi:hypothetical protein